MEYRYRDASEMKDSGVEWSKNIPVNWYRNKLKRELTFYVGGTPSTSNKHFFEGDNIWVNISDLKGKFCGESKTKITQDAIKATNMKKVPCGSLLYSFKLSVGQVAFATKDLYTNEAIAAFHPSYKYNLSFWYYALKTYLIENANENIYGAKILNQELINNANVLVPPMIEQEKIANFLDKKTSQFDSIISKKEVLIEKLEEAKKSLISEVVTGKVKVVKTDDGYELVKRSSDEMKDSGVEWLGEIPKDWELSKIKYILSKIGSGKTPKGGAEVYQNEGVVFIRSQNVHDTGLKLNDVVYISDKTDEEMKNSRVQKNDVLLNITGASIGRTSIFEFKDISANVNQHVCILRPIHKYILPRLLNKIIQSDYVQEQIQSMQTGSSREGLNFEQIANMNIAIDKNTENQHMIVKCLDEKINSINNFINKTKLQIEKLKEAKQSLISEVVTGKIEILD